MPKLFSPVHKALQKKKRRRRLPDKVGTVKEIKDLQGNVIFEGTETQWRKWVKKRRTPKAIWSNR